MKSEFEEKSFEAAANGELRLSSPHFYAPGQVAEGVLGFDVASFQPASASVWNYLQMAAPGGLRLLPNLWPTGGQPKLNVRLPSYVISLIIQYKRAEHMERSNASQFGYWGSDYYRFKIDGDQQSILEALELTTAGHAVVRYGSPAFHQYDVLEQHTLSDQVLANTNFVPPQSLAGHEAWTYVTAGTTGYANARPEEIKAESWLGVQELVRGGRKVTTVLKHLRELANSLVEGQLAKQATSPDALNAVPTLRLDAEARQGLADLLTVSRVVSRVGGEWWMSVEPRKN